MHPSLSSACARLGPRAAAMASAAMLSLVAASSARAGAPCEGAPEAVALGIDPPQPPQPYALPVGTQVIRVTTTAQLQRALAWDPQQNARRLDIVLADGVYAAEGLDNGRSLRLWGSHRLWAETLGGAVLEFGIDVGGNDPPQASWYGAGAEFHGLVFDLAAADRAAVLGRGDPAHDGHALVAWGDSQRVVIEDCEFRGHGQVAWGIRIDSPNGFVARRLVIHGFSTYGLAVLQADARRPDLPAPVELRDLRVTDIDDPLHEPLFGEAGIWLAATGSLERAYLRRIHRAGVVTGGNLRGGSLRDLDIDAIGDSQLEGVGVYLDNTTVDTQVSEFCIGSRTAWGVRSEWDNHGRPASAGTEAFPRGIRNVVHHGLIEAWRVGVWFDQGTVDSGVHDVVFRGYAWAAIGLYRNLRRLAAWPSYDPQTAGSWARDNRFAEVGVCAVVRDQHPRRTAAPQCE